MFASTVTSSLNRVGLEERPFLTAGTTASLRPRALRRTPTLSSSRRTVTCQNATSEEPLVVKMAKESGYDLSQGMFGFVPFAEMWVGRWAMIGFFGCAAADLATGMGPLEQVGLTASPELSTVFLSLISSATAVGLAVTLAKAQKGELKGAEKTWYGKLFGFDAQAQADVYDAMDAPKPIDNFLTFENVETPAGAADSTEEAPELPKDIMAARDLKFMKDTEMTNGRWAMLGFAAYVGMEAAGHGNILGQIIFYCKAVGLLGPESGL